jgi:hypothetical protein
MLTSVNRPRTTRTAFAAVAIALAVLVSACQTPPLSNPKGTSQGLAPTSSVTDKKSARAVIDKVRTAGRGPKTGYARDEFGPAWTDNSTALWSHNGCGTRDDILKRDLDGETFRAGTHDCVVITGKLADPYTGKTINFLKAEASKVQIDHVIPLSLAWQMGAAHWTDAKRTKFANDPLNLLAVDGPTNGAKSDSSIASWLPPVKSIRCSYAVRQAQVSLAYDLPTTPADKAVMLNQCT